MGRRTGGGLAPKASHLFGRRVRGTEAAEAKKAKAEAAEAKKAAKAAKAKAKAQANAQGTAKAQQSRQSLDLKTLLLNPSKAQGTEPNDNGAQGVVEPTVCKNEEHKQEESDDDDIH